MSPHERIVLRLLAAGLSEKEIAEAQNWSCRRVERLVGNLERTLKASTQFALAVKATQLGLLSDTELVDLRQ